MFQKLSLKENLEIKDRTVKLINYKVIDNNNKMLYVLLFNIYHKQQITT